MSWSWSSNGFPLGEVCFEKRGIDAELQTEFLEQFVAPLLDQAAGRDDRGCGGRRPA